MSSLEKHLEKVNTFSSKFLDLTNSFIGAFGLVTVGWLRSDPANKFAIKSMKKHEIIQSKHVDHIENEKVILGRLDHPFTVSIPQFTIVYLSNKLFAYSWITMASSRIVDTFISPLSFLEAEISLPTIERWAILPQVTPRKYSKCINGQKAAANLLFIFLCSQEGQY